MNDFFRPEVLQQRQRDAVGRVLVVRPLPTLAVTALLLGVAAAVGMCLFLGVGARKAPRDGTIVTVPTSAVAGTVVHGNVPELRHWPIERVLTPREPAAGPV